MWRVSTTDVFDAWFEGLEEPEREEVDAAITVLRQIGPMLSRPHADQLKGSKHPNMKELRVGTAEMVIRIAFAFDPEQTAVLLVAGDKSGVSEKRFYRRLIAKADALYDGHLMGVNKRKQEAERQRKEQEKKKKGDR